jgi:hypothetical protein
MREEALGNRLGQILEDICIPDDVLAQLSDSLLNDKGREEKIRQEQAQRLEQRRGSVRRHLDQAYLDKLDGRISQEFWERKASDSHAEEQQIQMAIQALDQIRPECMLDALRILELANKAYFLYVKQSPGEQAKLLKLVLSNCAIDAVSIYPTYRKPVSVR